jgi:hypothetical protein
MNGVFWTVRLPSRSVDVNLGEGRATMSVQNLRIPDFGDVANALKGGRPIGQAVLGFHINWSGVTERFKNRQASLPTPFAGSFVKNTANMHWTAVEAGKTMVGLQKSTSVTILGHERNGEFFTDEDEDDDDD